MVFEQAERIRIRAQLSTVFTPAAPVTRKELFAGRFEQISQVLGAVSQVGQNIVLFGERGVGKTSLSSLIGDFWTDASTDDGWLIAPRINCDSTDTFESIWRKVAEEIHLIYEKRGLQAELISGPFDNAMVDLLSGSATPNNIRRFFDLGGKKYIVIIDEFDRLQDRDAIRLIADTIKTLSGHLVRATLVLVGVADTVEDLIEEHASIDRALVQVLMPRMSTSELEEIVRTALERVGLSGDAQALQKIAQLSQGLPHYAHLLGLTSAMHAVDSGRREIQSEDVSAALSLAVERAQESIRKAYHRATTSPRPDHRFREVLLACAVAPVDDLGYFAPADVRRPLTRIIGKRAEIQTFIRHLNQLCDESRGTVLQKTGAPRKQRFRFTDPLLKPYVVLHGVDEKLIGEDVLATLQAH